MEKGDGEEGGRGAKNIPILTHLRLDYGARQLEKTSNQQRAVAARNHPAEEVMRPRGAGDEPRHWDRKSKGHDVIANRKRIERELSKTRPSWPRENAWERKVENSARRAPCVSSVVLVLRQSYENRSKKVWIARRYAFWGSRSPIGDRSKQFSRQRRIFSRIGDQLVAISDQETIGKQKIFDLPRSGQGILHVAEGADEGGPHRRQVFVCLTQEHPSIAGHRLVWRGLRGRGSSFWLDAQLR